MNYVSQVLQEADIATNISRLSFSVDHLQKQLRQMVTLQSESIHHSLTPYQKVIANHGQLLQDGTHIGQMEQVVDGVTSGVASINQSMDRSVHVHNDVIGY